MKEFIKNDIKVLALIKKAMEEKIVTYEEINAELKENFPVEQIDKLISGMMEQGIKIVSQDELDEIIASGNLLNLKRWGKRNLQMLTNMICQMI